MDSNDKAARLCYENMVEKALEEVEIKKIYPYDSVTFKLIIAMLGQLHKLVVFVLRPEKLPGINKH